MLKDDEEGDVEERAKGISRDLFPKEQNTKSLM